MLKILIKESGRLSSRYDTMALLEVKNLGISFGGLRAVDDFNVAIEKGQLYGLIGPKEPEKQLCLTF